MRKNLRTACVALVASIALGLSGCTLSAGSPSQSPAAVANSYDANYVTLVIDFGKNSDRDVIVRKDLKVALGAKSWQLFETAALTVEGTADNPQAFVCRIEGWPTAAAQDCKDTPTYAEGNWAYFVTNPELGSGWLLSPIGAAGHSVICGGYEAWVWVEPNQSANDVLPRFEPKPRGCA
ncbi:MAG: hypothetical protein RLY88_133 [Actinomycetota bacterium]|jgi:hypothetical protein